MTFDDYINAIRTVMDDIAASPVHPPTIAQHDAEATATWQTASGHTAAVVTTLAHGAVRSVRVFFDTFASDETWTPDQHGAEALGVRIALRLGIEARS